MPFIWTKDVQERKRGERKGKEKKLKERRGQQVRVLKKQDREKEGGQYRRGTGVETKRK